MASGCEDGPVETVRYAFEEHGVLRYVTESKADVRLAFENSRPDVIRRCYLDAHEPRRPRDMSDKRLEKRCADIARRNAHDSCALSRIEVIGTTESVRCTVDGVAHGLLQGFSKG